MKKTIYINIIIILILILIFINLTGKRYIWYIPTLKFLYPNSNEEVNKVIKETINRKKEDIDFFNLTDKSVINAFKIYFPNISSSKYYKLLSKENNKILLLKYFINRPRPYQINKNINVLKSKTADTPAFPAGHAAQAYIIANYLQKVYPNKKKLIEMIADKCNDCRIKAGLHYPSDGMYSKLIFYKYN